LSHFNKYSWQIVKKSSNIKFHENSSSGSWVVTCGWANMTKVTVAFHNSAYTPNNMSYYLFAMPDSWQFMQQSRNFEPLYGTQRFITVTYRSFKISKCQKKLPVMWHLLNYELRKLQTLAVVSPRCNTYRWWTAARDEPPGWGWMRKTWKSWPRLSAVRSSMPDGSNDNATMGSLWAMKWAMILSELQLPPVMDSPVLDSSSRPDCRVPCTAEHWLISLCVPHTYTM